MRIWIVKVDGEPDYASNHYGEVFDRYAFLVKHIGEERVEIIHEDR